MSRLSLAKDILSLQLKFLNAMSLFKGKGIESKAIILFLSLIHAKTHSTLFSFIKISKNQQFFLSIVFKPFKSLTKVCCHDKSNASQSTFEISSTLLLFLSV